MSELDSYYKETMANISRLAEANESFTEAMFFEDRMKILIEDGHSTEHEEEEDKKKKSKKNDEIHLSSLIAILEENDFRLYIEPGTKILHPFVHHHCYNEMEILLNIFAYKN